MTELRPYQQEAIDAVFDFWSGGGGNPLVEMATGTGKSVVLAKMAQATCEYPDIRVLALVHVRELVEQNFMAFMRAWPGAPAGIYSAGLNRRDAHHRITFASIQSVYKRADLLGPRQVVLVDEAHLIPKAGNGMYNSLLNRLRDRTPDLRIVGLSATPYRLDSGRLDQGDGALFDETVYSYNIGRGIADGFLSPLISPAMRTEIDVSGVAKRGGEFVAGALERAADVDRVTQAAVDEITQAGAARKSWLVFCTGIKHAFHVRDAIRQRGFSCETVTGDTPSDERASILRAFKAGRIRALTNAQVLTTGFDAPGVDLVAMLRPTLSTGLYVQIVGRGTRLAEGKENCLVLDFAGNVRRHGPVDSIEIKPKKNKLEKDGQAKVKANEDDVLARECPSCHNLIHIAKRECPYCGHVFPFSDAPKHDPRADTAPILSSAVSATPEEIPLVGWEFRRHRKEGSPDSLRVEYLAGLQAVPEWLCFEHPSGARDKAARVWLQLGGRYPAPATVSEALDRVRELTQPTSIRARRKDRFWEVVGRKMPVAETAK